MITDIFAHLQTGAALAVSILDGREAGQTAIKIDEARVEIAETWARFDDYGFRRREAA